MTYGPLTIDPAAYGVVPQAYGQLTPLGFWGNLLGSVAQPIGGAIGGLLGNQQLGSTLGGLAGQLGRLMPFGVDPMLGSYAYGGGQLAPQSILLPQTALDPETQASNEFLQGATSGLIPQLSQYVSKNIGQYPVLADVVPLVTRAAELYAARDYARAYVQAYQAYRSLALLRTRQPSLPSL